MNQIVRVKHEPKKLGILERFFQFMAPQSMLSRMANRKAAQILRSYEAASKSRRTSGWHSSGAGANSANGASLAQLRFLARDLERNNGWARRGTDEMVNNVVGWGIQPRSDSKEHLKLWKKWADKGCQCDATGHANLGGLEALVMRGVFRDGEQLIVRRRRPTKSGIPLQLEVLEPDHLDTLKDRQKSDEGNRIVQGVEIDVRGKPVAYWLFPDHPGDGIGSLTSKRVPAEDVIHCFNRKRAGQQRGASELSAAILKLEEFSDYEDAILMRQKIAACFAAFVTNVEGDIGVGTVGEDGQPIVDPRFDALEPGQINYLSAGETIEFGTPPPVSDNDSFSKTTLRAIAASMNVTYEGLTGDYSQVNYSSARMGRITHYAAVKHWRWNVFIPQVCDRIWEWFEEAAISMMILTGPADVTWTPPPMPMIDPDKEGQAARRNVRSGLITPDEMVAEQGNDPETHWDEYAASMAKLDARGIKLDCDPRYMTDQGIAQVEPTQQAAE